MHIRHLTVRIAPGITDRTRQEVAVEETKPAGASRDLHWRFPRVPDPKGGGDPEDPAIWGRMETAGNRREDYVQLEEE